MRPSGDVRRHVPRDRARTPRQVADVERVAREIHILKMLRHPHIIQLYEIIETSRQLYLLMESASPAGRFGSLCR